VLNKTEIMHPCLKNAVNFIAA